MFQLVVIWYLYIQQSFSIWLYSILGKCAVYVQRDRHICLLVYRKKRYVGLELIGPNIAIGISVIFD